MWGKTGLKRKIKKNKALIMRGQNKFHDIHLPVFEKIFHRQFDHNSKCLILFQKLSLYSIMSILI